MTGYAKCFGRNKTMSSKVIDNKLLKKYTIWEYNMGSIQYGKELAV